MPIKTLDEYLKQVVTHTVTDKQITKQKYMIVVFYKETEFQETPIGKIPKEWKKVKLGDIAEKGL